MLDSHQLNVFIMASETMNFTHAAKMLHMSQPSVSQHIQSLENHFNLPLFMRNGSRLQLTEAGMILVPIAKQMVNHSIHIDEIMSSLHGDIYGNIMVGCSTTPGKYALPKLLALFHNQYSKVSVTCCVSPQAQAMEMLSNGDIHFTLAGNSHITGTSIEIKKFICDHVKMIAPTDHPWSKTGRIQIEDLFSGKFIHREKTSGTFQSVEEALRTIDVDINQLTTVMTLGNSESIALAVKEGLGVGFVSESVVNTLNSEGIQVVVVDGLEISRNIYFCRNTNYSHSGAQEVFWEFITKNIM